MTASVKAAQSPETPKHVLQDRSAQFASFALSHGLVIRKLKPGNQIQRCATIGRLRRKDGAYHFDGERGWVTNWRVDGVVRWFSPLVAALRCRTPAPED
jgi:hypothetical protein